MSQQLKELAQRATPWPWKWFTSNSHNRLSSVPSGKDGDVISAFKAVDGVSCVSVSRADMAFIEASHPGAVIDLIERLEAAERERDELIEEVTRLKDEEHKSGMLRVRVGKETEALKAELARRDAAAGAPVVEITHDGGMNFCHWFIPIRDLPDGTNLYTAAQPAVLRPEKITEIMQDAWNEFCDDTGCYPDDFEYQNERLFFDAGRWAMLVAERISSLGAQPQKVVELPEHIRPALVDVLTWIERLPVPTKSAAAKAMRLRKAISDIETSCALYEVNSDE